MPNIFISYAQNDQSIAKRLSNDLSKHGLNVWFDKREILAGDSIMERIREGIRSADYLLVLISCHSKRSDWVEHEIGFAFDKFGDEATSTIIPVRVDDSPVPPRYKDIRYVDLVSDYDEALSEIITRIQRDKTGKASLNQVIDTESLAANIASEKSIPRSAEFYITVVLGIMSILATLIAAWPAFQEAFGQTPRVYYDVKVEEVSMPPGTDEQQAIKVLKNAGIAPAALRIRIVNKGKVPANNVKIGSKIEGEFLYIKPNPPVSSKAVWVKVSVVGFKSGDNEAVIQLDGLVPDKKVLIDLGYEPRHTEIDSDIVSDGLMAQKVPDVDKVPSWSFWQASKLPFQIFTIGIVLSILVWVILVARKNPRLREKLLDLLKVLPGPYGELFRIFYK